jgi:enamine deaminase RidA (YjgF/YER057c/UK114 family)
VMPTRIPTPWTGGTYSDSVSWDVPGGRFVFVSGQIGARLDGEMVTDTPDTEADQMFERVRISLEKAGAAMSDVVQITAWIVNFSENFPIYGEARGRAFGQLLPASTAVGTPELAFGARFEVQAVAFVPAPAD